MGDRDTATAAPDQSHGRSERLDLDAAIPLADFDNSSAGEAKALAEGFGNDEPAGSINGRSHAIMLPLRAGASGAVVGEFGRWNGDVELPEESAARSFRGWRISEAAPSSGIRRTSQGVLIVAFAGAQASDTPRGPLVMPIAGGAAAGG